LRQKRACAGVNLSSCCSPKPAAGRSPDPEIPAGHRDGCADDHPAGSPYARWPWPRKKCARFRRGSLMGEGRVGGAGVRRLSGRLTRSARGCPAGNFRRQGDVMPNLRRSPEAKAFRRHRRSAAARMAVLEADRRIHDPQPSAHCRRSTRINPTPPATRPLTCPRARWGCSDCVPRTRNGGPRVVRPPSTSQDYSACSSQVPGSQVIAPFSAAD